MQRIVFTTRSHDQGYSSYGWQHGSYENSWTGFRARIVRASATVSSSSSSSAAAADGRTGDSDAVAKKPEEYHIQTNVHASDRMRVHTVVWGRGEGEEHGDVVSGLGKGDVVQVVPYAQWPGWMNFVYGVRVEVFTSGLKGE